MTRAALILAAGMVLAALLNAAALNLEWWIPYLDECSSTFLES